MAWNLFTNTGSQKTSGTVTAGVSTIASASSIAITSNSIHLITGTTGISAMTGGVLGSYVTLVASGQSTGVCVVLNNGTTANALSLRDSANFGIYAGESVTFVYNGTYWVETSRNLKKIIDYAQATSNVSITGTSLASPTSIVAGSSITWDGSTKILLEFYAINSTKGTTSFSTGFYEDGSNINQGSYMTASPYGFYYSAYRITPTAGSHTYSVKGCVDAGSGQVQCGVGGSGTSAPAYLRITRDA